VDLFHGVGRIVPERGHFVKYQSCELRHSFRWLMVLRLASASGILSALSIERVMFMPAAQTKTKAVNLRAQLTDAQAWNLAQFLKRVGFSEFRANAQDENEAYAMRDAADIVRRALADAGYAPR
jgi:predicted outer membrane lipoprotein